MGSEEPSTSINLVDLLGTRAKEIKEIEDEISQNSKKTMLFQRLPHYLRRRSRSGDKITRKHMHRKKDRHYARSHTFYAKRFFMLSLPHAKIPHRMRLKSDKYIYKSLKSNRKFFYEETFRGISECKVTEEGEILDVDGGETLQLSSSAKEKVVRANREWNMQRQAVSSEEMSDYQVISLGDGREVIFDRELIYMIGIFRSAKPPLRASIAVIGNDNGCGRGLKEDIEAAISEVQNKICRESERDAKVYRVSNGGDGEGVLREDFKIVCRRSMVMLIFEKLQSIGFIPIGLREIERIAVEREMLSPFEIVNSEMFKLIDESIVKDFLSEYEKKPAAKRAWCDLEKMPLYTAERGVQYFSFSQEKGCCKRGAEILVDGKCIGRVIRAQYCYSRGSVRGVGYVFPGCAIPETMCCRNLDSQQIYSLRTGKVLLVQETDQY